MAILGLFVCIGAALYLAGTTIYYLVAGSLEPKDAAITGVLGFTATLCYVGLACACLNKLRQPWFV